MATVRRGSDRDGIDEQNLESWVDHFLLEMKFSNCNLSGYYPNMYGRLNWVKAFGAAGENRCFPRMADMPLTYMVWRLIYLVANFAVLAYEISKDYDGGHPYLVKMPVSSMRYHGNINELLAANQALLDKEQNAARIKESTKRAQQSQRVDAAPPITEFALTTTTNTTTQRAPRGNNRGSGTPAPPITQFDIRADGTHPLDVPGQQPHYAIHVQLAMIAGARCPVHMPLPVKITWMLQGIAYSYGLWVTILFWTAVVTTTPDSVTGASSGAALLDHGLGFALIIIDFNFNNIPFLLPQCVWCLLYAFAYVIWSLIFFHLKLTSKYSPIPGVIYPPVNWYNWPTTLFIGVPLVILGGPLTCFCTWFLVTRHRDSLSIHGGLPWIDLDGRSTSADSRRVPRPWWCACC